MNTVKDTPAKLYYKQKYDQYKQLLDTKLRQDVSQGSSMSNEVSYTNELQPSESPYPSHSLNLHPDPVYGGNEDSFENLIQTSQEEDSSSLRGCVIYVNSIQLGHKYCSK
ncbi:hypothetical protein PROFUN_06432 [Planoprotostelium fungivorum]|uniref:Uncharacterized protein n=1 Tax=Planoprotostelium fungivorum TaxID=1890364 RepID=A0A2P6NNW0_9EUKA|nr:hypothetical protein PROFUN_06432 [Planoprotostelium fungivorum]